MKADIKAPKDRGETISQMEPLWIRESSMHRGPLADLALELMQKSTALSHSLPPQIIHSLSSLVRSMNCYYSNLIEGHDTHPIDIERALQADYSQNREQRDLQLEAQAHIDVQHWIDQGGMSETPTSQAAIQTLHQRFCSQLPDKLLWVQQPDNKTAIRVEPGQLRQHDVIVGRHVPISPGALPRFMQRFETAYSTLGKVDTLIVAASAHHRLLWLHPFLDGNGRVARLMSHAILQNALNTCGIWSISRGLARQVEQYKAHLANCDAPRRGDLDGRGNLSEANLAEFVTFFFQTCIDQIEFMESLIQPERLRQRILLWTEEEMRLGHLPARSDAVLEAVLYRGTLPRGDITTLLGSGERQARRITAKLIELNVLHSQSSRAPFHLRFPATLAGRWLPGLFPDL